MHAFTPFIEKAIVIFDNSEESRLRGSKRMPLLGTTSGKNDKGLLNGTLTGKDMADLVASLFRVGVVGKDATLHYAFPDLPGANDTWRSDRQHPDSPVTFHEELVAAHYDDRGHVLVYVEGELPEYAVIAKNVRFPLAPVPSFEEVFGDLMKAGS